MPHPDAASGTKTRTIANVAVHTGCRIGVRHDSYQPFGLKEDVCYCIIHTSKRFADEPPFLDVVVVNSRFYVVMLGDKKINQYVCRHVYVWLKVNTCYAEWRNVS